MSNDRTVTATGCRILRLKGAKDKSGLSGSSIYEKVARGEFPKPVRLGVRAVGWFEDEIEAWLDAKRVERDGKVA